jgi:hypothetical protein
MKAIIGDIHRKIDGSGYFEMSIEKTPDGILRGWRWAHSV